MVAHLAVVCILELRWTGRASDVQAAQTVVRGHRMWRTAISDFPTIAWRRYLPIMVGPECISHWAKLDSEVIPKHRRTPAPRCFGKRRRLLGCWLELVVPMSALTFLGTGIPRLSSSPWMHTSSLVLADILHKCSCRARKTDGGHGGEGLRRAFCRPNRDAKRHELCRLSRRKAQRA